MSEKNPSAEDKSPVLFPGKNRLGERIVHTVLFLFASVSVVVSAAIIYTLLVGSGRFFMDPGVSAWDFLFGTVWMPNGSVPRFGVIPLLTGTTLIAGGALLIGAPLGISAAVYLSEFARDRVRKVIKPMVEILAGIPSIVYGFFALLVISPIFRENFGASYFNAISAIIVMSIMVIPIIVSISDDSMRAVPKHLKEASLAMGATRWETTTRVVVPSASSGIMASVLLGLARALGETMVVMLVAGSIANLTLNPLGEVQTMTAYIAQTATGDIPPGVAVDAAFAVGLLLFLITYVVNMMGAHVVMRVKSGKGVGRNRHIRRFLSAFDSISSVFRTSSSKRGTGRNSSNSEGGKTGFFLMDSPLIRRRYLKEKAGRLLIGTSLVVITTFLLLFLYSIVGQAIPGMSWTFLTSYPSYIPSKAGIFPAMIGSIYLMALTMLFAVPVGVGAAIYLNEIAADTRYSRFLRRIIQNLAGVPSIVFGLVGLAIFARALGFGPSLLSGGLILAIMVLPIIVVSTEEALKSVPYAFRDAAKALGATKWQAVRDHVLPNALPGIMTGSILALSRAIGETAPILFIGSILMKSAPSNVMSGFTALPLTIFYWTKHPKVEFHDLAASTSLVLLIILFSMNILAIIIRQRAQARRDW